MIKKLLFCSVYIFCFNFSKFVFLMIMMTYYVIKYLELLYIFISLSNKRKSLFRTLICFVHSRRSITGMNSRSHSRKQSLSSEVIVANSRSWKYSQS